MSRVRNANEFLDRLRKARGDYDSYFREQIENIRETYSRNPTGKLPPHVDQVLEAHVREYFVNAFLSALNWRLEKSPGEALPNLIPESPVDSSYRGTTRFLDYLGIDTGRQGGGPLLIVETKRPRSPLPKRQEGGGSDDSLATVVHAGLCGESLGAEWEEWIATLRDYVQSVKDRTGKAPRRVVITSGEWLILFTEPEEAFCNNGSPNPKDIFTYSNRDEIEENYKEIFEKLEHQNVLNKAPILTIGEVPFYVRPEIIDRAMFGLRLMYIETPGLYRRSPSIKVAPVVYVGTQYGAWFCVDSHHEREIPHQSEEIVNHLDEIDGIARQLLSNINSGLGATLVCSSLINHYHDGENSDPIDERMYLPGIREINRSQNSATEFLVLTGHNTHFFLNESSVPDCPHHNWAESHREGYASDNGPVEKRSTWNPRSFFISREVHHCAHRDVREAKGSRITDMNRDRCGPRSGGKGEAFCEIWRFEEHLCCRTCAFEDVCTRAQVFNLPCQRPQDN